MRVLTRTIGMALVLGAAATVGAQGAARATVAPTSKLWIEGTSNVHAWKCEASPLDAAIDIDALGPQFAAAVPKALKKVTVKVPVKSLKCGHGKMDDNLYKALNADKNSEISYVMTGFESVAGEGNAFTLKTTGTLTIAGTEKTVAMDVAGLRLADGTVKATGALAVKMTTFGVKPPSAMFGTIKTGDEVTVKFELVVGPRVVAAAPAGR